MIFGRSDNVRFTVGDNRKTTLSHWDKSFTLINLTRSSSPVCKMLSRWKRTSALITNEQRTSIYMRYNPRSNLLPVQRVINKVVDCIVRKFVLLEHSDPCLAFLPFALNVVPVSRFALIYGLANFNGRKVSSRFFLCPLGRKLGQFPLSNCYRKLIPYHCGVLHRCILPILTRWISLAMRKRLFDLFSNLFNFPCQSKFDELALFLNFFKNKKKSEKKI